MAIAQIAGSALCAPTSLSLAHILPDCGALHGSACNVMLRPPPLLLPPLLLPPLLPLLLLPCRALLCHRRSLVLSAAAHHCRRPSRSLLLYPCHRAFADFTTRNAVAASCQLPVSLSLLQLLLLLLLCDCRTVCEQGRPQEHGFADHFSLRGKVNKPVGGAPELSSLP